MENNVSDTRNVESKIILASQQYSGPLPQANELIKYNEACPDAAERIIAMAERQAKHRQMMEVKEESHRMTTIVLSIVCATLCVLFLCGVIVYAIYMNATLTAIAASITAISAVAGIFVYHKKKTE